MPDKTKYEKRMLKIWDKWNPDECDIPLEHFIKDSHPAIREIRERVDGEVQSILLGIEYLNKEKRERFIEEYVFRSFQYEKYNGKKYCSKNVDETILRVLFGINFYGGSECIRIENDDEREMMKNWSGKSHFDFDHKDLDTAWDEIWEWNQEDQHYGSNELKDWIWQQKHFILLQYPSF